MKVLLLQLDGKLPNIALMRIAAHHRALGDDVEFRRAESQASVERRFDDDHDRVYASAIFTRTRPIAERLLRVRPDAIVGGTGWDVARTVEDFGITTMKQEYGIYPRETRSIGFTQRGCRLKCKFCVVPTKEGAVRFEQTIEQLWRGPGYPKNLLLLDNDFFGNPEWREAITAIRDGGFRVCFSQGINARMLTDETAEAIGSIRYYDDSFTDRRIYTAWDNRKDEARLFAGLEALVRHGVKPDHIMVYMLVGYWPGETHSDREHRRKCLREFGARPYPMPYQRTPELIAYQRWVVKRMDLMCSWEEFYVRAKGRPEHVKPEPTFPMFDGHAAILAGVVS
jgi:hypothetical protein